MIEILDARKAQVLRTGSDSQALVCDRASVAGSVSQRACVFCGARVVLYPIADALHLVHGPVGCAAYTWDIRGALSSGPELHRLSFSTDLREQDVVHGGERKLERALRELITRYKPNAAFVYATCIAGLIGDDVDAVCRHVAADVGFPVLAVHSAGFGGTKKDGYAAACAALEKIVGSVEAPTAPLSINVLGDFNVAGESWIVKDYYRRMGVNVVACLTGDGRVAEVQRAHTAQLNLVQCSGSMTPLAKRLEERYGTPWKRVSYFGLEDTAAALYEVARFFGGDELLARTAELVRGETEAVLPEIARCRAGLTDRRAAVYVGGAFKAFSLVRALRRLGMVTAVVGSQTGNRDDYEHLRSICDEGTIIVDDTNPLELARFCLEQDVDLLIGGVKERPIAYKLGIAFCDHNHERKRPLAGFVGMGNFCREVYASVLSPVWDLAPARAGRAAARATQ